MASDGREVSRFLRRRIKLFLLLMLLMTGGLFWLYSQSQPQRVSLTVLPAFSIPSGHPKNYATSFATTEYPISERGVWISGKTIGLDWTNIATTTGLAYGTESGKGKGDEAYDDSTALLTGTWEPDQTTEAEVHSINQRDDHFEEVELRLRSTLNSHFATGYEVLFRCSKTANAYASIARWDGELGKFTYLSQKKGPEFGVKDGDVVKATIVGDVITAYINDVPVMQAADKTYSRGNPGMGFWFKRSSSKKFWLLSTGVSNTDCGFRRFAAWDETKIAANSQSSVILKASTNGRDIK